MLEQRAAAGQDRPRGGVIEGFYGRPWTSAERLQLFAWMRDAGLVDYLHAPKDDPLHRGRWREPYAAHAAAELGDLVGSCHDHGLSFVWALSPGLDIRYGSRADVDHILRRIDQVAALGVGAVAILFDDIPGDLAAEDAGRFGSLALAQASVANAVSARLADTVAGGRVLVCPTPYCGRMAERGHGGPGYLEALGRGLAPGTDILWTGPEIISPAITVEHVAGIARAIGRRPVIWDNLYADDYDGTRFFVGPFAGRAAALREGIAGILLNAANELPLNEVPIHVLGSYLRGGADWDPAAAHREAIRAWLPRFALAAGRIEEAELGLLVDCFSLPHSHGPGAEALLAGLPGLLERPPQTWGPREEESLRIAGVLRAVCERLPDLVDRELFHALFRRIWDLREELALLLQRVANRRLAAENRPLLPEDEHLPGTFRGGLVADLRRAVPFPAADADRRSAGGLPLLRPARADDAAATSLVCLRTGDEGADGTALFAADPDALARIYVWPYLALEPGLAWVLEDEEGVCGYCLGALDSRTFHARSERDWRPHLVERFPEPAGPPEGWTAVQRVHWLYHHPDSHCPEPYERYPAHLHIDLLPHVQGRGLGRRMVHHMLAELRRRGAPGVHLAVANGNLRGQAFYRRLGFIELEHRPGPDGCLFMGLTLAPTD